MSERRHEQFITRYDEGYEGLGMRANEFMLSLLTEAHGPWHESPDEIRRALAYGREKRAMVRWVRSTMVLHLSEAERQGIELYYFQDLNYREAAEHLGKDPSSVCRATNRGVRKLRAIANRVGKTWRKRKK